ncbi:MAG TPA: T9SS type A sorting domain-containing protein [Ignavibacteria bacterium]|nr:T9SS type A sorting domain-containing protein [Ignavibacteria bacterium]
MNYLKAAMLVLLLTGGLSSSFAWDSETAKYMPLQVGNMWVYRGTATGYMQLGRSYQSYRITGIADTLGHKYYRVETRVYMITGTLSSGVMQFSNMVRIDSASMNFFKLGFYCNSFETLVDSLRSRPGDTLHMCPQFYDVRSYCMDTSAYSLFGSAHTSKRFAEFYGPGYGTVYVKGIGIAYSSYGYSMNQSYDTLRGCVINGVDYGDTSVIVGLNQISTSVPENFSLSQNYPNPFNPVTNFGFRIADFGLVRLTVFDIIGREIEVLVNQQLQPGTYEVSWDASNYSSGVYYSRLEAGSFTETKKMVLIK